MDYIPDLIPSHARVLPAYFSRERAAGMEKKSAFPACSYVGAISCFLAVVLLPASMVTFLLFGSIGFMLLPQGRRVLERKLRFRLTSRIRNTLSALLLLIAVPVALCDILEQQRAAAAEKIRLQREAVEKAVAEKEARQRHDSVVHYLDEGIALRKANKTAAALKALDRAGAFAVTTEDRTEIWRVQRGLFVSNFSAAVRAGKYAQVLQELEDLVSQHPDDDVLRYWRGLCYSRTGRLQDAVTDLKQAMAQGNTAAQQLHEQINPLRKKVLYYLTRCCDGSASPSNAKGRGACSHHGGVCDWNEPVYEAYRKYE